MPQGGAPSFAPLAAPALPASDTTSGLSFGGAGANQALVTPFLPAQPGAAAGRNGSKAAAGKRGSSKAHAGRRTPTGAKAGGRGAADSAGPQPSASNATASPSTTVVSKDSSAFSFGGDGAGKGTLLMMTPAPALAAAAVAAAKAGAPLFQAGAAVAKGQAAPFQFDSAAWAGADAAAGQATPGLGAKQQRPADSGAGAGAAGGSGMSVSCALLDRLDTASMGASGLTSPTRCLSPDTTSILSGANSAAQVGGGAAGMNLVGQGPMGVQQANKGLDASAAGLTSVDGMQYPSWNSEIGAMRISTFETVTVKPPQ